MHFPGLPVRALLRDRYPVAAAVAKLSTPITVVYGTADRVVPPEQSRAVAEAAAGSVELVAVPGADHNDGVLLDGPELLDALTSLARRTGCPGD